MTDNSKLTRKDLKGPDEFLSAFSQAVAWFRQNRSQALAAVAAVVLVVAAVSGTRTYFSWQEAKATQDLWPHLNRAREILQSPGKADDEKLVNIEQFLSSYVNLHPKNDGTVFARYYLGSIAFTRHNFDVSIAQFKAALALGKDRGVMRFLIRQGLAQALESKGDYAAATSAYHDASTAAIGDLKGQARLGEARTLSLLGKGSEAAAIYREIVASSPDPATKELAETKLARMQ